MPLVPIEAFDRRSTTTGGPIEAGNIDLSKRPVMHWPDGKVSTLLSMSFNEDGKETLIPMISDEGKVFDWQGAIDLYRKTGKHLGKFANIKDATAAAKQLSDAQGAAYGARDGGQKLVPIDQFDASQKSRIVPLDKFDQQAGKTHPLSKETVTALRAQGQQVAEPEPYKGFFDRAKQVFSEQKNLDQNALDILYRKLFGGQVIDPGTGRNLSEQDILLQQQDAVDRRRYLTAGKEPPQGVAEHLGDIAGLIAREATSPSAIAVSPVGSGLRMAPRLATYAGVGGAYEGVSGATEQVAERGEITDPSEIAIRAASGAVGAPVLDLAVRGVGKAISAGIKSARKSRLVPVEELDAPVAASEEVLAPSDVHDLAASKGIPSDNDPAFAAMTKEVTGKEHLDDLTPDELTAVASRIASEPQVEMQPGSLYAGMIDHSTLPQVSTAPAIKPIRREDILRPFLKKLGVPLYEGRVKGKGTLGFYMPKKEAVRVKGRSDLEVAAHEIAHLIDDRVFLGFRGGSLRPWIRGPKANIYAAELREVSYDRKKVYEGFAEYVRLWMTQPEKAIAKAPEFTAWWEDFVQKHEYGPALLEAKTGMVAWYNQGAQARMASKIGDQASLRDILDTPSDKFRQSILDDLHGFAKMERELTGELAPGGMYETTRLTRAASSIVEGAIKYGRIVVNKDGSHSFVGDGLEKVLAPVANDLDNWTHYAVGRSARELMGQGRERLFTRSEIDAAMRLETPAFKKAFDDYQVWNKSVVDFAQAKGFLNPATRALWKRFEYLPFYRAGKGGPGGKGRVEGRFSGVKALTGGTGNIRDVLGNMVQNANMLITESLKNEARVSVADMADKVRGGGRFMVKIPTDSVPVSIDKGQINRIVKDILGIVHGEEIPTNLDEMAKKLTNQLLGHDSFMKFWMHNQAPKAQGTPIVSVMRGGEPTYYEVADPILYRSFQALTRPGKNWMVEVLNGVRQIGQTTVTLTPDFMAKNFARDTLMAMIMTRHGFRPFIDSASGFVSRLKTDPSYIEFIANGGGYASHLRDEGALARRLKSFYAKKGIDPKTVLTFGDNILNAMQSVSEAFEMGTRIGEYKRASAAGANPRHAAYLGREISTDFSMRGDSQVAGFFYDSVVFLKAGVVSMDRMYRGVVRDPNSARVAAMTGALATFSMGLYMMNRGNPQYEKLEDWDRDTHWHFFIRKPNAEEDDPESNWHFRYPKLWEIGAVSSVAERSIQHVMDGDTKEFGAQVGGILKNTLSLDYVPGAIKPLYEQAMNRNRFTGRVIEPLAIQGLEPWARGTETTSKTTQWLGEITRNLPRQVQVPPARAEALLRGYFNTWAVYGLMATDAAFFDDKPSMRLDQYPVIRGFYSQEPSLHTKYETKFYEMLRAANEVHQTVRHLDKTQRPELAEEVEQRDEIYSDLQATEKDIRKLRLEAREVMNDRTIGPQAKRDLLDAIRRDINSATESAVKAAP